MKSQRRIWQFWLLHKRTFFGLVFLLAFSITLVFATPPTSSYNPGETLDPNCAPGDANCTVTLFPDQATHTGEYLQTDGNTVSWQPVTGAIWGSITGTLADQTDLQTALNAKQATLVSGTNIKTVNGTSLVGSGNVAVASSPISVGTSGNTLYSSGLTGTGQGNNSNIFLGVNTGAGSTAFGSNFFGGYAGQNSNASQANFFGPQAGQNATNANGSNFFGYWAGKEATNASNSNFIGNTAGNGATNASYSNFIGVNAGNGATGASNSNFLGLVSGNGATGASNSNFFGLGAGTNATTASYSNFIGTNAGGSASASSNSNFFGRNAGYQATNASYSNLFGYQVGRTFTSNNLGSNNIIIGTNISLSDTTANAINLGGILFGIGSYATTSGNPSIVAQTSGKIGIGVLPADETASLNIMASTTSQSSIRILGGVTPTSPNDGDIWNDSTNHHLYVSLNGTSYQLDQQGGGSGGTWGSITGTLSAQTDLQSALDTKQATLVSGTNIKTINSTSLLGSGDITIASSPISVGTSGNTLYSSGLSGTGQGSTTSGWNNIFGENAANGATNVYYSNFFGVNTGQNAINAYNSNFFGAGAGQSATNAYYSNFIGKNAGYSAANASNSIFIGQNAGFSDTVNNTTNGDDFSILIGKDTSTGGFSNSIALGGSAANTATNQFMIGSTTRPINQLVINGANPYLNFGTTGGATGYGLRDNAGIIEYKNSGGSWSVVGGGSDTTTASNGLTMSGSDVQLGGTLSGNTTIEEASHAFTFNNSSNYSLRLTGQLGLNIQTAAYPLNISTTNESPSLFQISNAAKAASVASLIQVINATPSPANGIGSEIEFLSTKSTGFTDITNQLVSKWTDATDTTRTSEFSITGVNSGTTATLFTLSGSGAAKLNKYGAGTFTGTAAYNLAVDASGNLIEVATGGGGSSTWGSITGTLSNQTDLQNALNAKQATLVSGTNIKTINGNSLLGSGDVAIVSSPISIGTLGNTLYTPSLGAGEGNTSFGIGNNIFFGVNTGSGAINTYESNFIGSYAGMGATHANDSNFIGIYAGRNAANANVSNFIGNSAGDNATNVTASNFFGSAAGSGATNASNSNFFGYLSGAGTSLTTGAVNASYSNFFGYSTGYGATNAANSIFIGTYAGNNDTVNNTTNSDDFSILIGKSTSTGGFSNSIALGGSAANTATNQFMIGSTTRPISTVVIKLDTSGATCTISNTGLACPSDINFKKNITTLSDNSDFILNSTLASTNYSQTLDKLLLLTPVTYNWKSEIDGSAKHTGFIAQEVEQIFPDLVSTDSNGLKSLNYAGFTPILAQAIKEMNLKITGINDVTKENSWRDAIIEWFNNKKNGINKIFTQQICLTDPNNPDAEDVCLTRDDIQKLRNSSTTTIIIPSAQAPATDPNEKQPEEVDQIKDNPAPKENSPSTEPSTNSDKPTTPTSADSSPSITTPTPTVESKIKTQATDSTIQDSTTDTEAAQIPASAATTDSSAVAAN